MIETERERAEEKAKGEPLIRLENISKSFGDVSANKAVSLKIEAGKVLALLGENGAGKTTLMSILAGNLRPDSGTIYHRGIPLPLHSPAEAIAAGIGMVYQHFKLAAAFSVAENIFLGERGSFFLSRKEMEEETEKLAAEYGIKISPSEKIYTLSMGEKQQVEILRLLHRKSEVLIFDEPTAVLTPVETENLFAAMRLMLASGKGIVFISHKLQEVLTVADNIAILRRGEIVDTVAAAKVTSKAALAERMVGRPVLLDLARERVETRQKVLQVKELGATKNRDEKSVVGLKKVSFELRQGEILGIVGVAGNGQRELIETICGMKKPESGEITLLGKSWDDFFRNNRTETDTLSWIAEDRQGLATCPQLDLLDNFLLTTRHNFSGSRRALGINFINRKEAKKRAEYLLQTFDIRPANLNACGWQLSGGNLQKLVLAREFYRNPRLIIAEQPTQGLDIAAMEEVWRLLLKAREAAGILLVTGDLSEALALSDRIGVMFRGRLVDCFAVEDEEKKAAIPQMMAGVADMSAQAE